MMKFTQDHITDQKRWARGHQLLYARTLLRKEAAQHHKAWRVGILAGGSPFGEINAIRELMPKAKIVAIDKDEVCLEAAIDAGADDVLLHDLGETNHAANTGGAGRFPDIEPFDLLHLDLCSNANPITQKIVAKNYAMVRFGGVYIVGFSYGRDVIEMYSNPSPDVNLLGGHSGREIIILKDFLVIVPELIRARLHWLFKPNALRNLHSVILYQGSRMPMCSVLFHRKRTNDRGKVAFAQYEPGDYEIQTTEGIDMTRLFDCPQDRIDAIRRKHAAIKAAYTRHIRRTEESAGLF